MSRHPLAFGLLLTLVGCSGPGSLTVDPTPSPTERASDYLSLCKEVDCGFPLDSGAGIDTLLVGGDGVLEVWLNDAYAQTPSREEDIQVFLAGLREALAVDSLRAWSLEHPVTQLVPNHERSALPIDPSRRPDGGAAPRPLVVWPDRAPAPTRGLAGRHIALWASHGWYYEASLDRWEWQRARLFTTVEDIFPTAFVLPYLAPMLERAGAYVWMPRERDLNPEMVIVDHDTGLGSEQVCDWEAGGTGFAPREAPYQSGENPWAHGTHLFRPSGSGECSLTWKAEGLHGSLAVYVSHGRHAEATPTAEYLVEHAGGTTRVVVDQRMAPGTWVYVGTYHFNGPGTIRLSDRSPDETTVSADAVRFGGGSGVIARNGRTSGRPRWQEGARYALQFDGMPASLVYNVTEAADSDYVDDYRNRGEWVNYLRGRPLGPNKDQDAEGLGVPVDVSLAFHTDAGITPNDSTIGTLAIYSSRGYGSDGGEARVFGDGMSRMANRDLADWVQTQIVDDVRALHDSTWTRRPLWDRDYSEAYRPNVPSMLLELLSHQNFADMRLGLDPRFRFDVSRAIYKALARFTAAQHGEAEPVIAPLAPGDLAVSRSGSRAYLSWQPVEDPLEPSATPSAFRVYQRKERADARGILEGGFDDGVTVTGTEAVLPVGNGVTSFYVTALNAGGESAASEVVATGLSEDAGVGRVLVISAFDRVGPPAAVDFPGWRGFPQFLDHGVPERMDLAYTGAQHEFDPTAAWEDDDQPGHGASHADREPFPEPGNTFDFAAQAGWDLLSAGAGRSFDTMSDEAFAGGDAAPDAYDLIYVQLGEERASVTGHPDRPEYLPFPPGMQEQLRRALDAGARILVSGSYVTEELAEGTEEDQAFSAQVLGGVHRAERASRTGHVRGVAGPFSSIRFSFNTRRGAATYAAEAPEAIEPAAATETVLRYADSNMSAAVAGPSTVTLGFPIETILDSDKRVELLSAVITHLRSRP
ncbi:MAG: hypothetical protein HKN29_12790 [Rhodothermales bacterium]|nr:hypothetical protein [Rhodothermales bacterium]